MQFLESFDMLYCIVLRIGVKLVIFAVLPEMLKVILAKVEILIQKLTDHPLYVWV